MLGDLPGHFFLSQRQRRGRQLGELFFQLSQTLRSGLQLSAFAGLLAKGATPAGQFPQPVLDVFVFLQPLLKLGLALLERGGLLFGA